MTNQGRVARGARSEGIALKPSVEIRRVEACPARIRVSIMDVAELDLHCADITILNPFPGMEVAARRMAKV